MKAFSILLLCFATGCSSLIAAPVADSALSKARAAASFEYALLGHATPAVVPTPKPSQDPGSPCSPGSLRSVTQPCACCENCTCVECKCGTKESCCTACKCHQKVEAKQVSVKRIRDRYQCPECAHVGAIDRDSTQEKLARVICRECLNTRNGMRVVMVDYDPLHPLKAKIKATWQTSCPTCPSSSEAVISGSSSAGSCGSGGCSSRRGLFGWR